MTDIKKPKVSTSLAEKELDKAQEQFDAFDKTVKEMTMDRMNQVPKLEQEGPKISQKDIRNTKDIYIKPFRSIGSREKFNENFRAAYEFKKEYVHFTAVNNEIIGDTLEFWTKPFAGMPAEEWHIPVNKPVWAPRYVAEQIKSCTYHRLRTEDGVTTGEDGRAKYYGQMVVDTTIQRLDAYPVSSKQSIFMGASGF